MASGNRELLCSGYTDGAVCHKRFHLESRLGRKVLATVDLVVVLPWNVALDDAPEEEGLSLLFLSIYFATSGSSYTAPSACNAYPLNCTQNTLVDTRIGKFSFDGFQYIFYNLSKSDVRKSLLNLTLRVKFGYRDHCATAIH